MHWSSPAIRVDAAVARRVADLSHGRPLVIDYYASRGCCVTVGDLRVGFANPDHAGPDDAAKLLELEPIGGVRVFAARQLRDVLSTGFEIRLGGPSFARRLWVALDRPEAWLEFLDLHPYRH